MFKNSRLFIGLSFSVFVGLLVGPQERALSQEAAAGVLEEIIVTARRRDESLMDTPVSITAFTTAELDARQIDQVHQIAESTPGLVFINAGGTGASLGATMYIRGVGQKDLLPIIQPGVGLYIDGAYIAQTSGGLANVGRYRIDRGLARAAGDALRAQHDRRRDPDQFRQAQRRIGG